MDGLRHTAGWMARARERPAPTTASGAMKAVLTDERF